MDTDTTTSTAPAPLVLVPGFWLGAWAWDDVATDLRSRGHQVSALTLPGLEALDLDRSTISFDDHVDAICDAVAAAEVPVVLAVHSGAGAPGHGALDRMPDRVAHMVYVDTGAASGPLDPDFADAEYPLPPPEVLAEQENLDGLSDEQLATFRQRAIPQPGAALRDGPTLTDDARLDVPATVVCTAFSPDEYRQAIAAGYSFVAGLADVRDLRFEHLPTSHWPMWSRPDDLARVLGRVAREAGGATTA